MKRGDRGFFGLAILGPKKSVNVGSLMRTAAILGASFVAVIGRRYQPQASDTLKSYRHIPYFEYETFQQFLAHRPYGAMLVGVELTDTAHELATFVHPEQAVYLMGAEDHGLPVEILNECDTIVKLKGEFSMNVAIAGSIVLYHRCAL
jgi:tRNA G18 (ribose-2'-O)-methylase SpoU